jgi:DNA repair protein RadD
MDCIVLLNPTASPGKHVQILGRLCRPNFAPGFDLKTEEGRLQSIEASPKRNGRILDFAGNLERLGPINDPRIPKKKGKGSGEIPIKICPKCGCYQHAAVRFCKGELWNGKPCDFEFTFETKIDPHASAARAIQRAEPELHWFKVDHIEYEPYNKQGSPAMMRVHYYCGIQRFSELVCIEHMGFALKRARDWWRARRPTKLPPTSTSEGIQILTTERVPVATNILVHINLKYPNILTHTFDGTTPMFVPDPIHPGHPNYKPKTIIVN